MMRPELWKGSYSSAWPTKRCRGWGRLRQLGLQPWRCIPTAPPQHKLTSRGHLCEPETNGAVKPFDSRPCRLTILITRVSRVLKQISARRLTSSPFRWTAGTFMNQRTNLNRVPKVRNNQAGQLYETGEYTSNHNLNASAHNPHTHDPRVFYSTSLWNHMSELIPANPW